MGRPGEKRTHLHRHEKCMETSGSKMPGTSPSNRIFFIDKRILFVIVTPHHDLSGRNSVVECHLAKVDVDGSNPFARSIFLFKRRHSQVVRQRSAKPLFSGSNPDAASTKRGGCLMPAPFSSTTGCFIISCKIIRRCSSVATIRSMLHGLLNRFGLHAPPLESAKMHCRPGSEGTVTRHTPLLLRNPVF